MNRCLIIWAMLLAGCGPDPRILDEWLQPAPGWTGPRPVTEQDFARAAAAEKAGRLQANNQLLAIAEACRQGAPC